MNIIYGNLGSGKSLYAQKIIEDGLKAKVNVAVNYPVNYYNFDTVSEKSMKYQLQNRPNVEDIEQLPVQRYNANKMNVLVVDECGITLNARDYNKKGRLDFNKWALQSRKRGWQFYLITQHPEILDSQLREVIDSYIRVRAVKNMPIVGNLGKHWFVASHWIGGMSKMTGYCVKRDWFNGQQYYKTYDTSYLF